MIERIKDYAKCVVRNRFTLAGYSMWLLGGYLIYSEQPKEIGESIIMLGSGLLGATGLGTGTYIAYRRAKKHIKKYENLDTRFKKTFSRFYCDQTGLKMAIEEAGLEKIVSN